MDKVSLSTLALAKAYTDSQGGGGGGTSNYNSLTHKPQINSIELTGNKTLEAYGMGALGGKDSASGAFTPSGSVVITDSKSTVNSITAVGTLPSMTVDGEKLVFNAGTLPTKGSDVSVLTGATATFTGTEGTVTVS